MTDINADELRQLAVGFLSASDLINKQSAQIKRMRAALVAARSMIEADRLAPLDCHTDYTGRVDEEGRSAATVYDDALRQIDEATGENDARE